MEEGGEGEAAEGDGEAAHEGDDVLEAGEEGSDDDDEDEDEDADKPLLPGLDEEFILVGLVLEQVLDAQHGGIRDDGVREERVQREQRRRDDVEGRRVVDVVDENVGDALLVVQQRAAHAHHDVEEAAEEQRAVEHGGELLLVVHRALRGGAVEGNGKAQATDAEHLREVFHALRPQERRLEVHFVVDASVHHVDNDRRQQGQQTADRHKGHGRKVTQQRQRQHAHKVDDAPEPLLCAEGEVPLHPRKTHKQVVEHNFVRHQTTSDEGDQVADI